tara:strand:- start:1890 stop:4712 length:2823 start_codon:yes stop_codon:yes gene_type:complete
MSSKKFRFVSPGVFLNEVDRSLLPKEGAPVGPVVIGRTQRGPGMRPVTVNSFLEFAELFGNPIPGGEAGDIWREGNRTSPTYASYAARAWLKNSTPLTVVRVLGEENDDATTDGAAGWETDQSPKTTIGTNGGAFGLFVTKYEVSGATTMSGTLAAIWYINSGSIRLQGPGQDGVAIAGAEGASQVVKSADGNFQFKAIVTDKDGASVLTSSFDFDPNSDSYIRKVFNTNPTLLGDTNSSKTEYFLGETFERNLFDTVGVDSAASGMASAFLVALDGADARRTGAQAASTGMIIAQDTGETGSFNPSSQQELFQFTALDTGEWANSNVKVSISDVATSVNPDFDPYGTFTVELRDARDSDSQKRVLETFTGCNLNRNSPNYVCAKIGDKYATWSDSERRFTEYGDYNNNSKYIYVTPSSDLQNGSLDAALLPFGFKGPKTFATVTGTLNTAVDLSAFAKPGIPYAASTTFVSGAAGANNPFTCAGPQIALRMSSSTGGITDPTDAYFGITTGQRENSTNFEQSYIDLTRMLPKIADEYKADSFTFSLDNIAYVSSSVTEIVQNQSYYSTTARTSGASITAGGPTPTAKDGGLAPGYSRVLAAGFNRFTMPLAGGFDGFNIQHRDPVANTLLTGTEEENYAVNSLKRSINAISDAEVVEMNVAVMPGITTATITNHLIDVCESRADALAIIDLADGYVPECENSTGAKLGSVDETVSTLKGRALNSSYACTYYPWVQTRDELGTGQILWVPPSVAALGTFASNDKKSAPWFAPAGFTRGGLSDGAAGVPVIGVREHLTRKMRDKLYENNVNPIAKFPAEGIVIFGQKTLQATPSALDRVNVRRMMLFVKRGISNISSTLLFDANMQTTWDRFLGEAEPFLRDVQARLGLTDYKIVLDNTTTTPDLIDRNIMYAKIFLKPARSIEFIAIDFVIQRTGASFDD